MSHPRVLVLPRQAVRAWPNHPDAPAHPVYPLSEALTRSWQTDAHFTAYEAPASRQRLSITGADGLDLYRRGGSARMVLLVVDVDDELTHRENTRRKAAKQRPIDVPAAWRADQAARVATLRADHPGVVAYDTRGGYRLLALLEAAHGIADHEQAAAWARWYLRQLAYLSRRYGIVGDPACLDWTRLYRLPHATREGSQTPEQRPVYGLLEAVGVWCREADDQADDHELHRLARDVGAPWTSKLRHVTPPRERAPRAPRTRKVPEQPPRLPPQGIAAALTAAIDALPRGIEVRHRARLAVVGTLRAHGWSLAALESLVWSLADGLGKDRNELVSQLVPSTVARVDADGRFIAEGWLREHAPAVLEALRPALPPPSERWTRRLSQLVTPQLVTRDQAAQRLAADYQTARDQTLLRQLVVTAGSGKTWAAMLEAVRAAREGKRTAILAPSHAVAREVLAWLKERGVAAHHLVSVASHETHGTRTCQHPHAARELAAGDVALLPILCDGRGYGTRARPEQPRLPTLPPQRTDAPCQHRATCAAYAAATEAIPADVLVVVGVHQHAKHAHRWLREGGAGGLLVVDEAPALLDTGRWTAAALLTLAAVVRGKGCVVTNERGWRGDLLEAAAHGITDGSCSRLHDVLVRGLVAQGIAPEAAAARVAEWVTLATTDAHERERLSLTPRPALALLMVLRRGHRAPPSAREALRVCSLLARALASEANVKPDRVMVGVVVREWGTDAGVHELRVGAVVEALAGALCDPSIGRVLLDATADPRLLEPYTGRLEQLRVDVADGAPVARTFIPWSHGTRRHLLDRTTNTIRWDEALPPCREAVALAAEQLPRGSTLAVVSYQTLTEALRHAWESPEGADPACLSILAPLRERGLTPAWGYYGALRGRNDWRHADGLVCLATPFPSGDEVAQLAAAIGEPDAARDVLVHAARAELEQAVARIRAPQRTSPTVVVVLASVPPLHADTRWTVHELVVGRPSVAPPADLADLADRLGLEGAAAHAGCSLSTVQRARRLAPTPSPLPPGHNGLQGVSATGSDQVGGGTPCLPCEPPFSRPTSALWTPLAALWGVAAGDSTTRRHPTGSAPPACPQHDVMGRWREHDPGAGVPADVPTLAAMSALDTHPATRSLARRYLGEALRVRAAAARARPTGAAA